ncbi:glycosyltransferase family A protein [Microcoleus sp. S28C3]|uniref:glycosyltransferase family A protein n=1 Tax=Microcoleus sp. S28C3 TaxID=3055414 RepID=UPI002FCF71D0
MLKYVGYKTYQNIEILVVDDCSTDTISEIVKSFAQKDSRFSLLQQSNAGVAARNLAIEKSKGEYIAPINANDIWYPQNL